MISADAKNCRHHQAISRRKNRQIRMRRGYRINPHPLAPRALSRHLNWWLWLGCNPERDEQPHPSRKQMLAAPLRPVAQTIE